MTQWSDTAFTDDERQLLIVFVTQAWVRVRDDPDMLNEADGTERLLRKLAGADTRLIARRPTHTDPDAG